MIYVCLSSVNLEHKTKRARFVNCKNRCIQLAAASDKAYQLLVHGRWFSPGTPASSTTKTGRHDIAESGVKHQK
jgi:hypothetical protein